MAANNSVIISFKTAYEIFKNLDLAKKRQNDYGTSDFEIVKDILHYERVELIDFSDQNLDPERVVSFLFFRWYIFMALTTEWQKLSRFTVVQGSYIHLIWVQKFGNPDSKYLELERRAIVFSREEAFLGGFQFRAHKTKTRIEN